MIPLPFLVYEAIAFPLKLFVAKYSVLCLRALGLVVWREGNIIMLPQTVLQVADACSGLRSLIAVLALGVALAFSFPMYSGKRLLLILITLPVAVIANLFRVVATGIIAHCYGAKVAEGFFHEFAGLTIFAFTMAIISSSPCL